MKFAHTYAQSLREERYPQQWLEAAIQYKELKKAIKQVEAELCDRGLHPQLINLYWHPSVPRRLQSEVQVAGDREVGDDDDAVTGFYYTLQLTEEAASSSNITPRLFLVLNRRRMSDVDNDVLALTRQLSSASSPCSPAQVAPDDRSRFANGGSPCVQDLVRRDVDDGRQVIDVPLTRDAQFFGMVRHELKALKRLQKQQECEMSAEIQRLVALLSRDLQSDSAKFQSLLYAWREIFRMYLDFQIFFSLEEQKAGQRSAASACERFAQFQSALTRSHLQKKLDKPGRDILASFLSFNRILLRNVKFLEINTTALRKIMKKFDKRTALHAQPVFLDVMRSNIPAPESIAKSVCRAMSQDLIGLVPQLDDYLCPICFSIAYKPVRLRCGHIFCIRCLVVMQQRAQSQCALCRDASVLDATGANFDKDLEAYLARYFPKETRKKLRDNQRAFNDDLYGHEPEETGCSLM